MAKATTWTDTDTEVRKRGKVVQQVGGEIPGLNLGTASKTTELEYGRG